MPTQHLVAEVAGHAGRLLDTGPSLVMCFDTAEFGQLLGPFAVLDCQMNNYNSDKNDSSMNCLPRKGTATFLLVRSFGNHWDTDTAHIHCGSFHCQFRKSYIAMFVT